MNTIENAKPAMTRNKLLESLTMPVCVPTEIGIDKGGEISNLRWRFDCGLAVADELTYSRLQRKAVQAARNQHLFHHRERHPNHGIDVNMVGPGEWSVLISIHGNRFIGKCP